MLELKNIYYEVEDNKEIIRDISLQIEDHFVAITGPNGGGKSTLAKIIAGIVTPTSGQILLDGEDITGLNITERANKGISFAFQQPVHFKGLTVRDLITIAAGKKLGVNEICDILSEVGLCAREYIDREINNSLSGGELKRIEIAMITAPYNTEEYEVLPVYEEPWVAVIPKGHPLYAEENDPVKPSELLPYDLLIPSRESRKGEIDKWFEGTGHAPVIRGRIAHMMNAYELSLHGVGISIYPASISSLIRDKDVCVREVEHPDAHASYALIWNKNHTLSHVAEEFIAYVKAESGQQMYYA